MDDIKSRLTGETPKIASKEDVEMADICGISLDECEGDYKTCSIVFPLMGMDTMRPVSDGLCCSACDQSHVMTARLATLGMRENEVGPALKSFVMRMQCQLADFLRERDKVPQTSH